VRKLLKVWSWIRYVKVHFPHHILHQLIQLKTPGSSILAKTAPQRIFTDGKVARIQFSVKDNGIGKFSPVLYPLRGCCLSRKA
jgi:hypothetical protein